MSAKGGLIYATWQHVPKGLVTKTQLGRMGLKLSPSQQPVAAVGFKYPCNLYDVALATPKRTITADQRSYWEALREERGLS